MKNGAEISVVIPTYERGAILVETLERLLVLDPPPGEILVIDQTPEHPRAVADRLEAVDRTGGIRWIRLPRPSIPRAMNVGLMEARSSVVLFLDDDILPGEELIRRHLAARRALGAPVVMGQVLQPGEEPGGSGTFSSDRAGWVNDVMAGNLSVDRELALRVGGFDENFVGVAYRFESEFAERVRRTGARIAFEPAASIRHLRAPRGGTRCHGSHLRTIRPAHSVGAFYYELRRMSLRSTLAGIGRRFLTSVSTRHHLNRPWWIPVTLVAETLGLVWAIALAIRGPHLLKSGRAGDD